MSLQDASLAVQARVLSITVQTDTSKEGQLVMSAVAELEVVSLLKGIDVQPGDKVSVHYWW
jgi:hypothetical protein